MADNETSLSDTSEDGTSLSENSEDDTISCESEDDEIQGCYSREPEYTDAEMQRLPVEKSDSEEDELNSSRLENLHWCYCHGCVIFESMTLEECVCCCEFKALLGEKLEAIKCITLHKDFKILCLNQTVLETACIRHRRYFNKFMKVYYFKNM